MSDSKSVVIEQTLKQCYKALELAYHNHNWDALVDLEAKAREVIEQVLSEERFQTKEIRRLLGDVQVLYKKVIDTCQQERDDIQKQIKTSQKRQQAINDYLNIGKKKPQSKTS